jgi:hypothetical protein
MIFKRFQVKCNRPVGIHEYNYFTYNKALKKYKEEAKISTSENIVQLIDLRSVKILESNFTPRRLSDVIIGRKIK